MRRMRVALFENRAQAEPTRQRLVEAGIWADFHMWVKSGAKPRRLRPHMAPNYFLDVFRHQTRSNASPCRTKTIGANAQGPLKVPTRDECSPSQGRTRFHILKPWRRILGVTISLGGIWLRLGSQGSLIDSGATAASANSKISESAGRAQAKRAAVSPPRRASTKSETPTYLKDVLPILMGKCARCHNNQSHFMQNWLEYRTASAERWEIKRRIWDSWKGAYFKQPMPTANSPESEAMTDEERTTIRNWVESGALCGVRPAFNSAQSKTQRIELGKRLFATICAACHQPTGQGIPGRFPPLAGSDFLNSDKHRAIKVVVNGLQGELTVNGQRFNNSMPQFPLTDDDIANALTYVYNSFGNSGKEVTPQEVNAARAEKEGLNLAAHNKVPDEKSPFE